MLQNCIIHLSAKVVRKVSQLQERYHKVLTTERAGNCIVASLSALRVRSPLPTNNVLNSLCCKAAMFKCQQLLDIFSLRYQFLLYTWTPARFSRISDLFVWPFLHQYAIRVSTTFSMASVTTLGKLNSVHRQNTHVQKGTVYLFCVNVSLLRTM